MDSLVAWIDLLPPLIVLACAAITRHVTASLTIGILSASLLVTKGALFPALYHSVTTLIQTITKVDQLYLFAFLAVLGTIIELMTHLGGIAAYANLLRQFVHNKRGAETASLLSSCIFFLDDYLNSLMTGSTVRELTDSFKVPRVKLAFLINTMSSPLCPLIPITSWAALILGQLAAGGISDQGEPGTLIFSDSLLVYLTMIPFIFYSFFIILSGFVVVRAQLSFGVMKKQELLASTTGDLFGGKTPPPQRKQAEQEGHLATFFVPLIIFILAVALFLLWTGNSTLLGGANSFIEALKNAQTTMSLFSASLVSLVSLLILMAYWKVFSFKQTALATKDGILLMKNSLLVLILAFTFGAIINHDLQTGPYLAQLISSALPLYLLPLIIFLLATIFTASTGSSWGTMALLMPLTIKTLASLAPHIATLTAGDVPLLYPSLGALIAGAVAGAHFSPITDATVVSAMSAGANHLDHVKTMMSYAFPALAGSCVAFLITGITANWQLWTSYGSAMGLGLLVTLLILFARSWVASKK